MNSCCYLNKKEIEQLFQISSTVVNAEEISILKDLKSKLQTELCANVNSEDGVDCDIYLMQCMMIFLSILLRADLGLTLC